MFLQYVITQHGTHTHLTNATDENISFAHTQYVHKHVQIHVLTVHIHTYIHVYIYVHTRTIRTYHTEEINVAELHYGLGIIMERTPVRFERHFLLKE